MKGSPYKTGNRPKPLQNIFRIFRRRDVNKNQESCSTLNTEAFLDPEPSPGHAECPHCNEPIKSNSNQPDMHVYCGHCQHELQEGVSKAAKSSSKSSRARESPSDLFNDPPSSLFSKVLRRNTLKRNEAMANYIFQMSDDNE